MVSKDIIGVSVVDDTFVQQLHECSGYTNNDNSYGHAVDSCYEDKEGKLWVANGEYCSQVNFCTYCGYKAKIEAEIIDYKTNNFIKR